MQQAESYLVIGEMQTTILFNVTSRYLVTVTVIKNDPLISKILKKTLYSKFENSQGRFMLERTQNNGPLISEILITAQNAGFVNQ